jgi:hypothetical integral membrane protein (TIGR02206 family)
MTNETLFNSSIVPPPFRVFSLQHLATLGTIAALSLLLYGAARGRNPARRKWLGRAIGIALLGYAAGIYGQEAMEHALSWQYSLPLDLCHLVLIACFVSLFRPGQFAMEIAYFWGLGGVLQAVVTPDLAVGFPSREFFLFFWGHGATLLAIVFLISGREFRPRKGSVVRMIFALNLYGLVVGVIDLVTGWDYGYLCRKPSAPSLLDLLGPWPWYLLSLELVGLLTFLLLGLPWRLRVLFREHGGRLACKFGKLRRAPEE